MNARYLATTRRLQKPDEEKTPPRLGGFGGFGVLGGVKLGSLASNQSSAAPSTGGLLPHELAARDKSAPKREPPPKRSGERGSLNKVQEQGRRERGPEHQAIVDRSRAMIAHLRKMSQPMKREPPQIAQSTKARPQHNQVIVEQDAKEHQALDQGAAQPAEMRKSNITNSTPSPSTSPSPAPTSSPAPSPSWGAFRQRKASTQLESEVTSSKSTLAPAPTPTPTPTSTPKLTPTSMSTPSWGAFNERKASTRLESEINTSRPMPTLAPAPVPPPTSTATSSWGAFSQRKASVQPESDVTSKKPMPTPTSAPTSTPSWGAFGQRKASIQPETNATSNKPAPAPTPASSWGAFSQRKASIEPSTTHETAQDRLGTSSRELESVRDRLREKRVGSFKTKFDKSTNGAWDALIKDRKIDEPSKGSGNGGGFWTEVEDRVSRFSNRETSGQQETRFSTQKTSTVKHENYKYEQDTPTETEEPSAPRLSRFEVGEETPRERERKTSSQKKREKKQSKHQSARGDEDELDDEASLRYEQKQRLKAEKQKAKQLEQEAQGPTPIFIPEFINVAELAKALRLVPKQFLYDLEEMGFENMSNDTIMTGESAALVAMEYGFEPTVDTGSTRDLRPREPSKDISTLPSRPPIVTIMGHVDHGKTTLLDWLRKSSVAAQEHGGITQHIGAFVVKMSSGKPITFLDTPGHAAFLTMRQRGAKVTDIVVLVVAADDSVMPQTLEALKHATAAKVPIIVAINKIDKEDARPDQVKSDLARHGVEIEDFGGDVQVVLVSGKTGQGMEDLEENIITLSEVLDVRAEQDGLAEGWVLESSVKQDGKSASVLVKRGTLRLGDIIVAGTSWAKIRVLRNEAGVEVAEAGPGTPVEILGWRELPEAGEQALQAPDEHKARTAIEYRLEMAEREESSMQLAAQEQRQREKAAAEAAAEAAKTAGEDGPAEAAEPGIISQTYIIRADVAGSVEAVENAIMELGNNEVRPRVLRSAAGQISEYDIDHASISNSIIINFNNPIAPHIKARADEAKVRIIDHSVIYHLIDDVRSALSELLPPKIHHSVVGEADVLQIFPINIYKRVSKNIAGCKVRNGVIKKTANVKVLRKGEVVFDGRIDTLKHLKKNVPEMGKGTECGIGFEDFEDLQIDDQVQTYEIVEEKRTL